MGPQARQAYYDQYNSPLAQKSAYIVYNCVLLMMHPRCHARRGVTARMIDVGRQ